MLAVELAGASMISTHRSKAVVGLDIEAGSVAATEVTSNGTTRLGATGIAPLGTGVTNDGELADAPALAGVLKQMFAEHRLSRNVRIGIANQRVVVRTLRLPQIDKREEIESAIRFQAAEQIPMPLEQAVLDWQVLESDPEVALARQMDVVVVAARRESVSNLVSACRGAGLRPIGIDVSAFGMIRALADRTGPLGDDSEPADPAEDPTGEGPPGPARPSASLLCNLGDVTNLAVASGSRCLFTRVSAFGMEGIAQHLAERRELTLEQARGWLARVGLEEPVEAIDGEPEVIAACREALEEGARRLASELRLSLDYYGSQEAAMAVEEVVLCGQGTAVRGLPARMERELGFPVRIGRPPALATLDESSAARLTLAYGLALEE